MGLILREFYSPVNPGQFTTAPDVEPEEEYGIKPLPDRLLTELTAWRTLALRDAFASNQHIALTELLHTLVRDVYWQTPGADCLEAYVREISLPVHSPDMPGCVSAHALRQWSLLLRLHLLLLPTRNGRFMTARTTSRTC